MFWPCETRTSTCRSFATISSGLYRFLAIAVLLDVKDIPQVGPLQWGWITRAARKLVQEISNLSNQCDGFHRLPGLGGIPGGRSVVQISIFTAIGRGS